MLCVEKIYFEFHYKFCNLRLSEVVPSFSSHFKSPCGYQFASSKLRVLLIFLLGFRNLFKTRNVLILGNITNVREHNTFLADSRLESVRSIIAALIPITLWYLEVEMEQP